MKKLEGFIRKKGNLIVAVSELFNYSLSTIYEQNVVVFTTDTNFTIFSRTYN